MAIKNPSKCPECGATDIKTLGASSLPIIGEGVTNNMHAIVFQCNDCANLMFKSAH